MDLKVPGIEIKLSRVMNNIFILIPSTDPIEQMLSKDIRVSDVTMRTRGGLGFSPMVSGTVPLLSSSSSSSLRSGISPLSVPKTLMTTFTFISKYYS